MNNKFPIRSVNRFFRKPVWFYTLTAIIITALTFFAFKATLFNFLIIDDFSFITRLKEVVTNPERLITPFFHSYMDEPNYYRPLIICVWYVECLLWGANGLYFRIATIVCLLLTSTVLGLITFELSKLNNKIQFKSQILWTYLSAALFALYPLHAPTINWFAAQHTPLVTLFYLLSFWLYLRWRKSLKTVYIVLSLCSFVLAMLTEEMSVTLPVVLAGFEILFPLTAKSNSKRTAKRAILVTSPYWCLLAIYFCIRLIVLGAFVCKVSMWARTGRINFVQAWSHGIYQILVPIDFCTVPPNSVLTIAWQIFISLAMFLFVLACMKPNLAMINIKLGVLLVFWFLLCLVPADNIFAIVIPNLLNFRVAYLATAPLCIFMSYGIALFSFNTKYSALIRTCGFTLLLLSGLTLYCNNWGLAKVGLRNDRIKEALQNYCQTNLDESSIKILGLPLANSLFVHTIAKRPFIDRDIVDCRPLDSNYQFYPFGYLKGWTGNNAGKMHFLCWNEAQQKLSPTTPYWSIPPAMNFPHRKYERLLGSAKLKTIIHPGAYSPDYMHWESAGLLHIVSKKPSSIEINFANLPCWPVDFICFHLENTHNAHNTLKHYELHFINNINPNYPTRLYYQENTLSRITCDATEHELIFPLRNNPYWSLGGNCRALKLVLPADVDFKLKEIVLPETGTVIPLAMGKAYIQLSQRVPEEAIRYDASGLKDCTKVALELTGPCNADELYMGFNMLYSREAERNTAFDISSDGPTGILKIKRRMFTKIGSYKARLRALNKLGKPIGLAGDNFLINVGK